MVSLYRQFTPNNCGDLLFLLFTSLVKQVVNIGGILMFATAKKSTKLKMITYKCKNIN